MAASESNYGKAGGNELFGIKALPGQRGTSMATHEGEYGGTAQNATFATYDTPLDSVDAYVNLIKNHYQGAVGAQDLPTFVHGLKQGGYFTAAEPEYLGILQGISNRVGPDVQSTLAAGGQAIQGAGQRAQGLVSQGAQAVTDTARAVADKVSQFGDPQLSNDEAYAACGPAAAVRFAQMYGRNPTLREATDLAASVGWTSANGMAGLGSEKALMDKLGVPTRVVGPDIQAIATEAQTGNPVTISTQGHYFTADGYDPNSGAFHVGQSGLDLKGGSEWMTPAQMQARMGPIQGALFADNPQVPAPSTSDQTSSPASYLDRAKQSIGSTFDDWKTQTQQQFSNLGSTGQDILSTLGIGKDQAVSSLDQAVQSASSAGTQAASAVTQAVTPTSADLSTLSPAAPEVQQSPVDRLKSAFSDFIDQVGGSSAAQTVANAPLPMNVGGTIGDVARGGQAALNTFEQQRQELVSRPTEVQQMQANVDAVRNRDWGAFVSGTLDLANRATEPFMGGKEADISPVVSAALTAAGLDPDSSRIIGQAANFVAPSALERFLPSAVEAAERGGPAAVRAATRVAGEAAGELGGRALGALDVVRPPEVAYASTRLPGETAEAYAARIGTAAAAPAERTSIADIPWSARSRAELERGPYQPSVEAAPAAAATEAPVSTGADVGWTRADGSHGFGTILGERGDAWVVSTGTGLERVPKDTSGLQTIRIKQLQEIQLGDEVRGTSLSTGDTVQGTVIDQPDINHFRIRTPDGQEHVTTSVTTDPVETSAPTAAAQAPEGARAAPVGAEPAAAQPVEVGGGGGDGSGGGGRRAPPGGSGPDYTSVMPEGVYQPTKPTAAANAPSALESARRAVVRQLTDRGVDLNIFQKEAAKRLGRPLTSDEMVAGHARLAADPAARLMVENGLGPAVRQVGRDTQALRDYLVADSNTKVSAALGNRERLFSGGLTAEDSRKALQAIEQQLGPQRFAKVQNAADQVYQHSRDLRNRLVDSGVLSQEQAQEMEAKYPDWVKTHILDYMEKDGAAGGQGTGTKIGLTSRDVHAYNPEGTVRGREDPIGSTIGYTHQVERMARKNETFNAMLELDQAAPPGQRMLRPVADSYTPTKGQETVTGFVNGQKQKYVTDNKALAQAINGTGVTQLPDWAQSWSKTFRALATSRNPVFLAGNAALDVPEYTLRSTVREGGPLALPRVLAELGRGYADAFAGFNPAAIARGEFGPNTQRFIRGGGGASGAFSAATAEQRAKTAAELSKSHVFQINNKSDALNMVKNLLTLKPVESLGERVEYGPRVAAMRLAERRGENPVQSVLEGRDVTMDFNQGGQAAKLINQLIPFFNVGIQGPTQVARSFRGNPQAFAKTMLSLIGAPTIAAEAWNRSDPQRARDYKDVPQNVKDQGIVVMLPGQAPVDKQGNRHPQYAFINLRNFAPMAVMARTAAETVAGDQHRTWQELLGSVAAGASPFQASNVADLASSFQLPVPGATSAAQLALNHDLYRNRAIVTERNDQNASALSKNLTPFLQSVVDTAAPTSGTVVRPSAVDFAIRDTLAGVGNSILGASDVLSPSQSTFQRTGVTGVPVVGGLAGRFVRNYGGQSLEDARNQATSPEAQRILRSGGLGTYAPAAVGTTAQGVPLLQAEQVDYQNRANQYFDQGMRALEQTPGWKSSNAEQRKTLVTEVLSNAHDRAGTEVLRQIPTDERRQRVVAARTAA